MEECFGKMSSFEAEHTQRVSEGQQQDQQQAGNPVTSENYVCNDLRQCEQDIQADETHDQTKQSLQSSPKVRAEKVSKENLKCLNSKFISNDLSDKRPKADPCLKKILRAFRKEIKDEFVAMYGKKYFHWIDSTSRKRDKHFFTSTDEL